MFEVSAVCKSLRGPGVDRIYRADVAEGRTP